VPRLATTCTSPVSSVAAIVSSARYDIDGLIASNGSWECLGGDSPLLLCLLFTHMKETN
jgi:hypothetical protein